MKIIWHDPYHFRYIAAVIQGHVVPTVPYISDAATYSPESCFFGLLMDIGCILLGLVVYARFRQIQLVTELYPATHQLCNKLNSRALWIGLGSCMGVCIVANFQETNVRIVHYFGALCTFGLGSVYFWIQAVISYYILPHHGSLFKAHLRIAFASIGTILFFIVAVTGIISHILFNGYNPRKWLPSDGGWYFHVVSSICEWIVSMIFSFYILSFTDEFRVLSFDHPPLTFIEFEHEGGLNGFNEDLAPIINREPMVQTS